MIRWMIRRDFKEMLFIEQKSFAEPWDEEKLIGMLRTRIVVGMVFEIGEDIAGYMFFELHKRKLHLVRLAVHPDHRRQGVGSRLLEKLAIKSESYGRNRVVCDVKETNLDACLWLKAYGFEAVRVIREEVEDSYRFVRRSTSCRKIVEAEAKEEVA